MRESKGLYIHVPFCAQRCIYCDFYSTLGLKKYENLYVKALIEELKHRTNTTLHSIYLGGGTPSLLSIASLTDIFKFIKSYNNILPYAEITIEVNPDDVKPDYIDGLLKLGINRISLGVQTFDDKKLSFIHRRHSAQEAIDAVSLCSSRGLKNISIDLIYGFPNQSLDDWEKDIDQALNLPITHLSSYALIYEQGTQLCLMKEKGIVEEVSDEIEIQMFNLLMDKMSSVGFKHYEISNFAKPSFEALHNTSYWKGWEYIGCGPGAHSYTGHIRRFNKASLQDYITRVGNSIYEEEVLSDQEQYEELVLTRLRLSEGLNLEEVPLKYRDYLLQKSQPYIKRQLLCLSDNNLSLSRDAIFISNSILSDLI